MRRVHEHHRRGGQSAELNMAPMIDVVFLLVIFFLVSSHLARRETRLQLALPAAQTGAAAYDDLPRVTINIEQDGSLLVGPDPVTAQGLVERLRSARNRHGDRLRVRLRGDNAVPYSAVEPALTACAEAGVEDIALAVFPARGGSGP